MTVPYQTDRSCIFCHLEHVTDEYGENGSQDSKMWGQSVLVMLTDKNNVLLHKVTCMKYT